MDGFGNLPEIKSGKYLMTYIRDYGCLQDSLEAQGIVEINNKHEVEGNIFTTKHHGPFFYELCIKGNIVDNMLKLDIDRSILHKNFGERYVYMDKIKDETNEDKDMDLYLDLQHDCASNHDLCFRWEDDNLSSGTYVFLDNYSGPMLIAL